MNPEYERLLFRNGLCTFSTVKIPFVKYQCAGNDFIMIDDRDGRASQWSAADIHKLCDRHYGIGADGLICIRNIYSLDFRMVYFNADGREGSMCGNGARCAVIFAAEIGVVFSTHSFMAYDGVHHFSITGLNRVKVSMKDVHGIQTRENALLLDTGSPHIVFNVDDLDVLDVYHTGRQIRYNQEFQEKGVNVNFLEIEQDTLKLRTYERGVENETEACGTGCVAAAIARSEWSDNQQHTQFYTIRTRGGQLMVSFTKEEPGHYTNVCLEGPVERVFEGMIEL